MVGVVVDVDKAGTNSQKQHRQLARKEALPIWGIAGGEHVGGGDGAGDRAALRRTGLSALRAVAQVRAQEHHDATVDSSLGEVEVRLRHVPFDVEIAERVVE